MGRCGAAICGPGGVSGLCGLCGLWITDPGSWIWDPGSRVTDPGSKILDLGSWTQDPGSRIPGPGCRILDPRTNSNCETPSYTIETKPRGTNNAKLKQATITQHKNWKKHSISPELPKRTTNTRCGGRASAFSIITISCLEILLREGATSYLLESAEKQ